VAGLLLVLLANAPALYSHSTSVCPSVRLSVCLLHAVFVASI